MERTEAYKICKERGHESTGLVLLSYPPMSRCKFCGTTYRYKTVLQEYNAPVDESTP